MLEPARRSWRGRRFPDDDAVDDAAADVGGAVSLVGAMVPVMVSGELLLFPVVFMHQHWVPQSRECHTTLNRSGAAFWTSNPTKKML